MWKIRVLLKKHLLGYFTTPYEFCKVCGRDVEVVFHVEDSLWEQVVGDPGTVRCLRCFDKAARKKGVWLRWIHRPL
jgi:hypothetical protein